VRPGPAPRRPPASAQGRRERGRVHSGDASLYLQLGAVTTRDVIPVSRDVLVQGVHVSDRRLSQGVCDVA